LSEWVAAFNGGIKPMTLASAVHPYPPSGRSTKRWPALTSPAKYSPKGSKRPPFLLQPERTGLRAHLRMRNWERGMRNLKSFLQRQLETPAGPGDLYPGSARQEKMGLPTKGPCQEEKLFLHTQGIT